MILVDANAFMYAAGRDHPHKDPSRRWLERVAAGEIEAVVDAEILREILHRYRALDRWREGRFAYDQARAVVPHVLPVTDEIVDRARSLLDRYDEISARDALHAAVVEVFEVQAVCSYDRDFDRIEEIDRIEPTATG